MTLDWHDNHAEAVILGHRLSFNIYCFTDELRGDITLWDGWTFITLATVHGSTQSEVRGKLSLFLSDFSSSLKEITV